ncbi:hypothetical protein [Bdellovibrio bacteriovorus]|uniref:hypothetical protein n=1 Tax=Bdellovibrio TaxID=958 RepID=UPI0035A8B353
MSIEVLKIQDSENSLSKQLENSFKALSQRVCMMLATEGVHRKPYLEGLPHFTILPIEKKQEIVENLTFFKELCEEQISEGYKLKDNSSFTWRAFRKLNYVPRADVFNYMSDEDLVEIYSYDSKQLYRNFKFFECCSYTLEELYSVEWWNLYERDPAMTMKIFDAAAKVISGEIEGSYVPGIEPHTLREIRGENGMTFMQQLKLISPLKKNKRVDAILVIESADVISN